MIKFPFAISHAVHWADAGKELAAQLANRSHSGGTKTVGWLYATDMHTNNLERIVSDLRTATGVDDWIGSIGMGVCWHNGDDNFGETFGERAVIAMIADYPNNSFSIFPPLYESTAEISDSLKSWMKHSSPSFGVVHGDPTERNVLGLVEALSVEMENVPLEIPGFLVGGLTSSHRDHLQIAKEVFNGGLSGIMFAPGVEVATGLTQGYTPIGAAHRVTESRENVVIRLNGEPAIIALKSDVSELLPSDINQFAGNIHAAFPVTGSDIGDYLVRNIEGIDVERGWLALGGSVQTGDQLIFVRRDPAGAEKDLVRMVSGLMDRLPGPARGGLYFSCLARGPYLFGTEGREMEIIGEIMKDVPLVGFFGQGEISNNRLYGYTGVLALFL